MLYSPGGGSGDVPSGSGTGDGDVPSGPDMDLGSGERLSDLLPDVSGDGSLDLRIVMDDAKLADAAYTDSEKAALQWMVGTLPMVVQETMNRYPTLGQPGFHVELHIIHRKSTIYNRSRAYFVCYRESLKGIDERRKHDNLLGIPVTRPSARVRKAISFLDGPLVFALNRREQRIFGDLSVDIYDDERCEGKWFSRPRAYKSVDEEGDVLALAYPLLVDFGKF